MAEKTLRTQVYMLERLICNIKPLIHNIMNAFKMYIPHLAHRTADPTLRTKQHNRHSDNGNGGCIQQKTR
ncbi:MAG: hypothetical protein Q4E55_08185 [Bacteroidales bacterium]|nr:hypothetical protein [Bacteroidales bacterium]